MTNNCLVKKFKGVVNDSSLPKLGIALGKIKKASSYNSFIIASGKKITIILPDNVDLWTNSSKTIKTLTLTGTGSVQYISLYGDETGAVDCEIRNYWDIIKSPAAYFGMDMRDWAFANVINLECGDSTNSLNFGNIEDLYRNTSLQMINVNKSAVTGSVNILADKMFEAGRTSGSLSIYASSTSVKKDGESFSSCTINFTSEGWSFSS